MRFSHFSEQNVSKSRKNAQSKRSQLSYYKYFSFAITVTKKAPFFVSVLAQKNHLLYKKKQVVWHLFVKFLSFDGATRNRGRRRVPFFPVPGQSPQQPRNRLSTASLMQPLKACFIHPGPGSRNPPAHNPAAAPEIPFPEASPVSDPASLHCPP